MSEDTSRDSSHSSAIMVVLVALPLLYALSIGPVAVAFSKYPSLKPMEEAAKAFYAPIFWLHEHTPLKRPIEEYGRWWEQIMKKI